MAVKMADMLWNEQQFLVKTWLLSWKVVSYPKVAYMSMIDLLYAIIWEIMDEGGPNNHSPASTCYDK